MSVRACVFNGKVVGMFNAHYRKSTEKDEVKSNNTVKFVEVI